MLFEEDLLFACLLLLYVAMHNLLDVIFFEI
jgi:hypothetical protein